MMALVAGQRSTLNPYAPLFVPAVYRQVEDFSPEWWELVKTSTWFRDFWLSQHPEGSFEDDVMDSLPDSFDLEVDDAQFEEMMMTMMDDDDGIVDSLIGSLEMEKQHLNVLQGIASKVDSKTMLKDITMAKPPKERNNPKSPLVSPKYQMKPAYCVSSQCTPRRIHQPR
ncbi:hypothetical protein K2173_025044 [Erythroxylum novogranatense]|uniref:Uncharacterized protein n=1 Tax=Erythroxylum novogranatense TaxID=1862640 RepID=A0AAV8UD78_9ROSI|nr:hypothetical protein K2173_025044 [Erythroxylum novogranatense]